MTPAAMFCRVRFPNRAERESVAYGSRHRRPCACLCRLPCRVAGLDGADYCGDDGDGYDADDDELEVLLHGRDAAEEVAEQGEQRCPCDAAEDVERDEDIATGGNGMFS